MAAHKYVSARPSPPKLTFSMVIKASVFPEWSESSSIYPHAFTDTRHPNTTRVVRIRTLKDGLLGSLLHHDLVS
jgi:hypothetical protein